MRELWAMPTQYNSMCEQKALFLIGSVLTAVSVVLLMFPKSSSSEIAAF